MKLKIIFDKESLHENYASGWGVSYLVGDKVLFDTAEKGEYLLKNLSRLKVDIAKIEKVVISHQHLGHHSGLPSLLKANKKLKVFACADISGDNPQPIAENIYTTGCLSVQYKGSKIEEQALIVKSRKGISLICGCAHPGVLEFIRKTKETFPGDKFYALIGGFHLMGEDKRTINYIAGQIKNSGVENIGPAHCSGFEAVSIFKKNYPENFLEVKVGQEFDL